MSSPYRSNAIPRVEPDRELVRFEAALRATRRRGKLSALVFLVGLATLAFAPMFGRRHDLPATTPEARLYYLVTAPPLPPPWGPPCDVTLQQACDF
jgi:hypothetical protein